MRTLNESNIDHLRPILNYESNTNSNLCSRSRLSQDVDHEGDDEFEARLAAERKLQASITDDMVEMAKQLKDTSLMASSMIQEDNRVCLGFGLGGVC